MHERGRKDKKGKEGRKERGLTIVFAKQKEY